MIQGSEEWLEWRKKGIGASDAPVIMGENPWKAPYELWLEKMGLATTPMNEHMLRGKKFEEEARILAEEMTGLLFFPCVRTHPKIEWMLASLDGLSPESDVLLEIKCPTKANHEKIIKKGVPSYYKAQLQHQLAVTGIEKGIFFSFFEGDGHIVHFERDEAYIEDLIEREGIFYRYMIEERLPRLFMK